MKMNLIKSGAALAAAATLGMGAASSMSTASAQVSPPAIPGGLSFFPGVFAAISQGLAAGLQAAGAPAGVVPFSAHVTSPTPVPQFSCCPGNNTGGTLPPLPDDIGPADAGIHHGNIGGQGSGIQNGHIGGEGSGGHFDANGSFVPGS